MPKLVRLSFDRNLDDVVKYNVYRDITPGITRTTEKVMEITQPNALASVEQVEGEVLAGDTDFLAFKSTHRNWVNDELSYPINVYVNDVPQASGYSIDHATGTVTFDTALMSDDVVTADYYFDAVVALDTKDEQSGVTMLGVPAKDNAAPTAPNTASIVADPANNQAVLTWRASSDQGTEYFYKVEAEDAAGNYSTMAAEVSVTLTDGLHALPYVVESSSDNGLTWAIAKETDLLEFVETEVDTTAPDAVGMLVASSTNYLNSSTGDVTLTWSNPLADKGTMSNQYRIKARDAAGNASTYTVVEPVEITTGLDKIVIKRKVDDGTYPAYDDGSTIVAEFADFAVESYVDVDLADETTYNYSVFVVDKAGNASMAATVQAAVGDATPPTAVTGLTATIV